MNIKIITSFIAISACLLTIAQDKLNFDKLLSENQLVFEKPDEFTETAIVENGDLQYDYALKYDLDSFEVRYSIFPLHSLINEYEESLNDPTKTTLNPNKYHTSMFMANILNVSQLGIENMPEISDFPEEAVNREFGADYGGTSFFTMDSEFGKNYDYCMMIVIHKKDIADVYISFLSNNREQFEEYLLKAFHSIRFE